MYKNSRIVYVSNVKQDLLVTVKTIPKENYVKDNLVLTPSKVTVISDLYKTKYI